MAYQDYLKDFDLRHGEAFQHPQPELYERAVAALHELATVHTDDLADRAYAQAMWLRHAVAWAQQHDLHEATRAFCLHALADSPCNRRGCEPAVCDHPSYWSKDGRPAVLVAQVYELGTRQLGALFRQATRFNIGVRISAFPSWHMPGAVLTVQYHRQDLQLASARADSGISGLLFG